MKFTKMQGIGNDYIYINCFEEEITEPGNLSKKLSDRHFGIGSDGLILICPSDTANFKMDMYNSDGSQAEMCGNGIRCVGKFVYDRGLTKKNKITVETLGGIKNIDLEIKDGKVSLVTVDMGEPELKPGQIPVKAEGDSFVSQSVEVNGEIYNITCVSMGNPHAIIFVKDVSSLDLKSLGPGFENHVLFPNRINTEFVEVIDKNTLKMRVWERGAGETLACGTGACAVLAAAVLNKICDESADIQLIGGTLKIRWDKSSNHIYMKGPAEFVFDGEI